MINNEDDDMLTLAKFYLSENIYQFTIFYSANFDILYNFQSPMSVASDELQIAASQLLQDEDIMYDEIKIEKYETGDLIAVYEGNRVRVVLLLKPQASNPIVQDYIHPIMSKFTEDFEMKYRKALKNYEEYTGDFTDIDDILENSFLLDLNFPHIARYKGFDPEDQLELYIFQAADKFCKKVGYLYLRNLLYLTKKHVIDEARNIVLTDPKRAKREGIDPDNIDFPPNEMFFIAMFRLRQLGMLEPIPLDRLNSYSKIKY